MSSLLKKAEAAAELRITVRTLDRLIAKGDVAVRRIGRQIRIERAALDEVGR